MSSPLWNHSTRSKTCRDNLLAFTVDHRLQADSGTMTQSAASSARSLGASHIIKEVNWGTSPLPPLSQCGDRIESSARRARYHLLLTAMKQQNVQILCTGHHQDDQVETSVMRFSGGSGRFGLAGMRTMRRWGMGELDSYRTGLGWAGSYGMECWIARPLLNVSKVCFGSISIITRPFQSTSRIA